MFVYRLFLFAVVLFIILLALSFAINGVSATVEWINDKLYRLKRNKKQKLSNEELEEFEQKGYVPYKK